MGIIATIKKKNQKIYLSPGTRILRAAGSLGFAFGLAEGLIYWVRMLLQVSEPMGHEILWVTPAIYGLLAIIYGLGLGLVIWLIKKYLPLSEATNDLLLCVGLGFISFLGFYNLVSLIFSTAVWAKMILALGLAYQTTLYLTKRRYGMVTFLARGFPWLVGTVIVLVVSISIIKSMHERSFLANLPPAQKGMPNVMLITLDTLRADHLSAYGYDRPTPNLDQFAREGMQYDFAISTSSWTLPAHATIMTGLYPHEHKADVTTGRRLDDKFYTLAEAFSDNGYVTAAFVANEYACAGNLGFQQGFSHYDDLFWRPDDMIRWTSLGKKLSLIISTTPITIWFQPGRKTAEDLNQEFLSWLRKHNKLPFFVWLNYFDPHDPYYAPPPYNSLYGTTLANGQPGSFGRIGASEWGGSLEPREIQFQMNHYDDAVSYLDAQLGILFERLRQANLYDSTIIVITSDHGEAFGEHDLYGHANSLYREEIHVPLLIRYPKTVPADTHTKYQVSLRDLAVTITSMAGLEQAREFDGQPLNTINEPEPALAELYRNPYHPPNHPVAQGDLVSINFNGWHAILMNNQVELFAFGDHDEQKSLTASLAGKNALPELFNQLISLVPRDSKFDFLR